MDYKNSEHVEKILSSVTDEYWNPLSVDLEKIWVMDFYDYYFWYDTEYGMVKWQTFLRNYWWRTYVALWKLLKSWWVERKDLPIKKIDYKNKKDIKKLLSVVTDRYWITKNIDLKYIKVLDFYKNYYWYWTEFWIMGWERILRQYWWRNNSSLKKILKLIGIERDDLWNEEINYTKNSNIEEVLNSVTDKQWNISRVDINNISMTEFSDLYFWYWTKYWIITWATLLRHFWWFNHKSLRKLLIMKKS